MFLFRTENKLFFANVFINIYFRKKKYHRDFELPFLFFLLIIYPNVVRSMGELHFKYTNVGLLINFSVRSTYYLALGTFVKKSE